MKISFVLLFWTILTVLVLSKVGYYWAVRLEPQPGQRLSIVGTIDYHRQRTSSQSTILLEGIWIDITSQRAVRAGDNLELIAQFNCRDQKGEIPYSCTVGRWEAVDIPKQSISENHETLLFIKWFRLHLQSIFHRLLPGLPGELLASMVLGGSDLPTVFKRQLSRVGLSHVVAASGMNVTLLAAGLAGLLATLPLARKYKVIVMITLIGLYSGLTGFDPPIVRAALMASAVFLAPLVGRRSGSWTGLILTALIMLWVKPALLINFGFLLSFVSMIGQIGLITLNVKLLGLKGIIIGVFLQTLAAILVTLPIVVIGFSQFSLISIVTNVLVVWVIEPLMFLGIAASLSGLISVDLARLVVLPARPLLDYFLWIVHIFDRPEFVANLSLHWLGAVGYYLTLVAFYLWLRDRLPGNYSIKR